MSSKIAAMAIVVEKNDFLENTRVLIVSHRSNAGKKDKTWAFPSRIVKDNETTQEAVVRAVQEEVGLDVVVRDGKLEWGQTKKYLPDGQWRCVIYVVKLVNPKQEICGLEEGEHFMWMSWDGLWLAMDRDMACKKIHRWAMSFSQLMWSMFDTYSERSDVACLKERLPEPEPRNQDAESDSEMRALLMQ